MDSSTDSPPQEEQNRLLLLQAREWRASGPAPTWLPDEVLEWWCSFPSVVDCFRDGLVSKERGQYRKLLTQSGIGRRGDLSQAARGKLAALCRQEPVFWSNCVHSSLFSEYPKRRTEECLSYTRLLELVDDPLSLLGEYTPSVLLLSALALELEGEAIEGLARLAGEEAVSAGVAAEARQAATAARSSSSGLFGKSGDAKELGRRVKRQEETIAKVQREASKSQRQLKDESQKLRESRAESKELRSGLIELKGDHGALQLRFQELLEESERLREERDAARAAAPSPWQVTCLGGAQREGGVTVVVETRRDAVVLDAGIRLQTDGRHSLPQSLSEHRVAAFLVSHAHLDHVGALPFVQRDQSKRQGRDIPVYMTRETRELAKLLLEDSARIQATKGEDMFDLEDVLQLLDHVQLVELNVPLAIPDSELTATFLPVQHLPGSCAIHLNDRVSGDSMIYSGDLGPLADPQLSLAAAAPPSSWPDADLLLLESTFGLGAPPLRRSAAGAELGAIVSAAIERGGFALLPCKGLGDAQELLWLLARERDEGRIGEGTPIYLCGDSVARALEICQDAERSQDWLAGDVPAHTMISGAASSKAVERLLAGEPGPVIATPAGLQGSWSGRLGKAMAVDPRHAVILTGIPPDASGRKGQKVRRALAGVEVACVLEEVFISAHAPGADVLAVAAEFAQRSDHLAVAFLHGSADAQRALAAAVKEQDAVVDVTSLATDEPWVPRLADVLPRPPRAAKPAGATQSGVARRPAKADEPKQGEREQAQRPPARGRGRRRSRRAS